MKPPTAMLVDDEPQLVAYLRDALATLWPELSIIGEAADGKTAIALYDTRLPDIAFLDIQIPGKNGIEVARHIAGRCNVVFVTAYEQYAILAFERAAVDYLLKPVSSERLEATVARLKARLVEAPPDIASVLDTLAERFAPPPAYLQWLKVQHRQDTLVVPVEEVDFFQASEKYTLAITRDQEWLLRTPLKELEGQLDPVRFWKVHRNAIVRVGAIARVSRDEHNQVVVHLRHHDRTVAVSRAYAHRFRQM